MTASYNILEMTILCNGREKSGCRGSGMGGVQEAGRWGAGSGSVWLRKDDRGAAVAASRSVPGQGAGDVS